MQISQIPRKFELPFANGAGGGFIQNPIPTASQIGVTPGAASLTDGFPPLNFSPITSGGVPPRGVDFNGLLFQITGWNQWQAAGGPVYYDSAFQATIGGYPKGAVVGSVVAPGNFWYSLIDNNTDNPDTGTSANWTTPPFMKGTGDVFWRASADAQLLDHIVLNGTTIGSASSGASQASSGALLFVYQYFWNKFSNSQCPVTSGRGANATADFNANKPIQILNMQATGIFGVDGMGGTPTGLLANVPVTSGGVTQAGSIVGENLHTLLVAELAQHSHVVTDPTHVHHSSVPVAVSQANAPPGGQGWTNLTDTPAAATGVTNQNTGSNTPHNNVPRSMLGYWFMHI